MKNEKVKMLLLVLGMGASMVYFSPAIVSATELETEVTVEKQAEIKLEKRNTTAMADETGFVIENGVLTEYTGNAEKVIIPDGVTAIGDSVFSFCYDLKEVVIPDSVTSIGWGAFRDCTNLTEIIIPDSVTSVGAGAFYRCHYLRKVVIPNSISVIESNTFSECGIIELVLPDSITEIGDSAFSLCPLEEQELVIPSGVTTIGNGAFSSTCLEKVVISNGVTAIGSGTFSGCPYLTEVIIPNTVTSIGGSAFSTCRSLEKIVIPNSVTTIGAGAFYRCENLEKIIIPNSIVSIGENAFGETRWLNNKREENPLVIVHSILVDAQTTTGKVVIPDSVSVIGESAFSNCTNLTEISIPDSVSVIGSGAFYRCSSLTEVIIPNSVSVIENGAFNACTNLTELVLSNNISVISSSAFYKCSSLKEVVIPNGVTSIEKMAFFECSNLQKIVIPESVTFIGEWAFSKQGLTIYGYVDSYAQIYAQENGIPFVELKKEETPQKNPFSDVSQNEYYYTPVLWALENEITSGLNENQFGPEQACTRGQVVTFLWRAMGEPEPTTTKNPFKDVSSSEYYYKAVLWAYENGITAGLNATTFAPDATVTRSQFVTFLHRAEGKPSYETSNPFKDVKKDYYYDAILWAYENGITAGLNATTFGTEDSCTRGQVVTFLYRALSEK